MSTIVRADTNGAVTLPADLCRSAGVQPGAELVADVREGRIVVESTRTPIWDRIAGLAADAPQQELAKLPKDGAAQIDHYLYGTPKK